MSGGKIYNLAGAFLGGVALGVAGMYLADPVAGARRRAVVRDQAVRLLHDSQDFLGKAGLDLGHRAQGLLAGARSKVIHRNTADEILAERVRSKLGRYVSHPRAIEITTENGTVRLRGPVLEAEREKLLEAVSHVSGVDAVESQLEAHRIADVPELQGGSPPPGEPAEWEQRTWSPGIQLLAGVATVALLAVVLPRLRRSGSSEISREESLDTLARVRAGL